MKEEKHHHILCNYWTRPVEGCEQCARLKVKYPDVNEKNVDEKVKELFPSVVIRKSPNEKDSQ